MWAVLAPIRFTPWLCHVRPKSTRILVPRQCQITAASLLRTRRFSRRASWVRASFGKEGDGGMSMKDYLEQAPALMDSADNGGPRWFTPLECGGSPMKGSPLLLYLPGLDGVGLGLWKHHHELGKIFEVWCLHIPNTDRTPFPELIKFVEDTVKSKVSPNRPIYLVGEGVGGCLALSVAANNPNIDLVLILANPATNSSKLKVNMLKPLFKWMRSQTLVDGEHMTVLNSIMDKMTHLRPYVCENILQALHCYSVGANISSIDSIMWKLEMLVTASTYTSSRLATVKAQTLILSSVNDWFEPSAEEGERLCRMLPNCYIRRFDNKGHFLFLEDNFDLVYTIKRTGFYRLGKSYDCVGDYSVVTTSDIRRSAAEYRFLEQVTHPIMFSTLEDGEIVRGLAGIPVEGPTLFVGYHMLTGIEAILLVTTIFAKKNILVRGLAHPNLFQKSRNGRHFDFTPLFDSYKIMGCVPVSGLNMSRLLKSKSHILLYPGGMREAFHRKGEHYKLFWPKESEFVRMASSFGAKIVPFGVVGADDMFQLCADFDDLVKVPFIKQMIEVETNFGVKLRGEITGEIANQPIHVPIIFPKLPGRFYFLFGKPIETKGRQQELREKQKAHELYLHIKSDVERSIAYLKAKREQDPYRNLFTRLLYQSVHSFKIEVPTFDL